MKQKSRSKDTALFSPRTISLVLIGLIAGLITAFYIMNTRAAQYISDQASQIFQLPVTVDDVNISYVSHSVRISGLKIKNPDGFTGDHVAIIEDIRLYSRGLHQDPIPVSKIEINGIIFYPERDAAGETNLAYLLDGIFDQTPQDADITLSVPLNKIFIKDMRLRPIGEDYTKLDRKIIMDNRAPLSDVEDIIEVTPEELVQMTTQALSPQIFRTLLTAQVTAGIDSAVQVSQDFIRDIEQFSRKLQNAFSSE